jgi:uncharacterized repeat protein (TIGR01451 family)
MNTVTDSVFKAAKAVFVVSALAMSCAALAQEKNCIELTTVAETAQQYVNEQGQTATRLAPVGKALPGDEIIWTVTAKNVCSKPVENVVVANPVPEHMTYVANSAIGIGTDIAYSADGKEFKPFAGLTVHGADGAARAAKAEDVRNIRWTYSAAFAPGATAFVRYRATLN